MGVFNERPEGARRATMTTLNNEDPADPRVHEPQRCPVCDGEWHAEDCELGNEVAQRLKAEKAVAQLRAALRLAREGYASEAITGLPVLPQWRERTMAQIDEALGA
jgi:hypothetical protein